MADQVFNIHSPKTSHLYHSIGVSDKYALETKIKDINQDFQSISKFVKTLIQAVHNDDRKNETQRYTELSRILKDTYNEYISQTIGQNKVSYDSFKNKIVTYINGLHTINKSVVNNIRTQILSVVDDSIHEEIGINLNRDINGTFNNIDRTKILNSILSNKFLVKEFSRGIINQVFSQTKIKSDLSYISNKISAFKSINRSIFVKSVSSLASRSSFGKLLKDNGNFRIILIKYNKLVISGFKTRVSSINVSNWNQIKNNIASSMILTKISKDIKEWWKRNTKFINLISLSFWKKKFKGIVKNVVDYFKHRGVLNILSGAFGIIRFIGRGIIKTGFKLATTAIPMMFDIFSGITSLFGRMISSVSGIVKLSINIVKNTISGAFSLFKRISLFLLSPPGAYITGFIVGMILQKINQLFPKLIKTLKDIKKWISERIDNDPLYSDFKKWLTNNESQDKSKFGFFKHIVNKSIDGIKESKKNLREYASILTDKNLTSEQKWERMKIKFWNGEDGNTNKIDKFIGFEKALDDFYQDHIKNTFGSFVALKINYSKLILFFTNIAITNEAFNDIISFSNMRVGKTRFAIKAGLDYGTTMISTAIGALTMAFGGPYGALIGQGIGAILHIANNCLQYYISRIPLSTQDATILNAHLSEMDDEFSDIGDFGVLTKEPEQQKKKIDDLTKEIDKKKAAGEDVSDLTKQLEQLNSEYSDTQAHLSYKQVGENFKTIKERVDLLDYEILAGASPDDILDNVIAGKRIDRSKYLTLDGIFKHWNHELTPYNTIKSAIISTFQSKSEEAKDVFYKLLQKYNDGEISLNNIREIYKSWNEVYNNYEWFRKNNGESPITIGEIIDIDKQNRLYLKTYGRGYTKYYDTIEDKIYSNIGITNHQFKEDNGRTIKVDINGENEKYRANMWKWTTGLTGITIKENLHMKVLDIANEMYTELEKDGKEYLSTGVFSNLSETQLQLLLIGNKKYLLSLFVSNLLKHTDLKSIDHKTLLVDILKKDTPMVKYLEKQAYKMLKLKDIKIGYSKNLSTHSYEWIRKINSLILPTSYDQSKLIEYLMIGQIEDEKVKEEYDKTFSKFINVQNDYEYEVDVSTRMNEFFSNNHMYNYNIIIPRKVDDEQNASSSRE